MTARQTVLVGVEDTATAGIVAVEAARVAMDGEVGEVSTLVLLHVLDAHPVMNAVFGMGNYCAPVMETIEDGERLLALTEQAIRAEFAACGREAPEIRHEIAEGEVGYALSRVAQEHGAGTVVLGARRPHAFGRLIHPDVRSHVCDHVSCRVHVAALQETPPGLRA